MNFRPSSEAPLHVGLFSPALPSKGLSNGIVTYAGIMREQLRSLGHLVTLTDGEQIERADGSIADLPMPRGLMCRIQTLVESWKGGDRSHAYIRLRTIRAFHFLKAAGVEIVEIEETWGWAARMAGNGIPVVMRLHGPHALGRETVERSLPDIRREAAELRAFANVQAVTSPSERLLDAMADLGGRAKLSRVIRNPVPLPREQWSVEKVDPNQLLVVGRFDFRKGADVVVRAFAKASETLPLLKLVMVGPNGGLGGIVRFEEFVQTIPAEARRKIEFLGEQPPERINELRLGSGLAIVASRFETFCYAAFEAQALGMPLLGTDTFGLGEMIVDGVNGRLVKVADVDAMAETILEMVGDQVALARMGAAGRKMVSREMNPRRIAQETVALYSDAMQPNDEQIEPVKDAQ